MSFNSVSLRILCNFVASFTGERDKNRLLIHISGMEDRGSLFVESVGVLKI